MPIDESTTKRQNDAAEQDSRSQQDGLTMFKMTEVACELLGIVHHESHSSVNFLLESVQGRGASLFMLKFLKILRSFTTTHNGHQKQKRSKFVKWEVKCQTKITSRLRPIHWWKRYQPIKVDSEAVKIAKCANEKRARAWSGQLFDKNW